MLFKLRVCGKLTCNGVARNRKRAHFPGANPPDPGPSGHFDFALAWEFGYSSSWHVHHRFYQWSLLFFQFTPRPGRVYLLLMVTKYA
jgi:hypothetical protein